MGLCRRFFKYCNSFLTVPSKLGATDPPKPQVFDIDYFCPYPAINFEVKMKHYQTLFSMKTELKKLVEQIRADKEPPRSQHTRAMYEFRHLHIARCLIKGRTMEEIEGDPETAHKKTGNKPDMKYVQKLVDHWKPIHEAEVAAMKEAWAKLQEEAALVPA